MLRSLVLLLLLTLKLRPPGAIFISAAIWSDPHLLRHTVMPS